MTTGDTQALRDFLAGDVIHVMVTADLSWLDRLRVLLGRSMFVSIRIQTSVPSVGQTETTSIAWAEPIFPGLRQVDAISSPPPATPGDES